MVDFKGLDDVVARFDQKISDLTEELEQIKSEIERVKKEYHDEAVPHNQGIREYILEKAQRWEEQAIEDKIYKYKEVIFAWKPAENAIQEIECLSDVMKRKLNKKSVILYCRCNKIFEGSALYVSYFFFTDDSLIYTNTHINNTDGRIGKYLAGDVTYSIPYSDIKDMDVGFNTRSERCLKLLLNSEKRLELCVGEEENASHLNTLLWDIYEFVNG